MKRNKRKEESQSSPIPMATDSEDTMDSSSGPGGLDLDAEIDKILDEKAAKTNFTVLNVKSMIRQVVKNKMVQKMIASTVRKSERQSNPNTPHKNPRNDNQEEEEEDEDDDDLFLFEPKLTRAKTKELLEKNPQQLPVVWPISPVKLLKVKSPEEPSEAQILITQHDLPEESEAEDDEYVPKEADFHLSDDDSNSVTSASDLGSPSTSRTNPSSLRSKRRADVVRDPSGPSCSSDPVFKTPSPRRKFRCIKEAAIGLRTRSKLPLNDTALEDLEKQFIPPDVTTDMYDWTECDNTDYLQFLQNFMGSTSGTAGEGETNDDEEADPEYNIMEDEEDDHDKEEHRVDRAVKVPKKELNELFAELFDTYHIGSEDELEEIATNFVPANVNHKSSPNETSSSDQKELNDSQAKISKSLPQTIQDKSIKEELNEPITILEENRCIAEAPDQEFQQFPISQPQDEHPSNNIFTNDMLKTLRHQMQAHVQLLAQTYVLSIRIKPHIKTAETASAMVTSLHTMSKYRGPSSILCVQNLEAAVEIVQNKNNNWPPKFISPSPIKKRILETEGLEETLSLVKEHGYTIYEKMIYKLMGESRAFMYPFLLPIDIFSNDCSSTVIKFTFAEDSLIARGLYDMKQHNMSKSILEDSKILHRYLLPARTPEKIYHRIRNVKKVKFEPKTKNPLNLYFQTGVVPGPNEVMKRKFEHITIAVRPFEQSVDSLPFPWSNFSCNQETLESKLPIRRLRYCPQFEVSLPILDPSQTKVSTPSSGKGSKKRKVEREPKVQAVTSTFPFMNDFLSGLPNNAIVYPITNDTGQTLFYYSLPPEELNIQPEPEIQSSASTPLHSPLSKYDRQDFSSPDSVSSGSSVSIKDSPVEVISNEDTKPINLEGHIPVHTEIPETSTFLNQSQDYSPINDSESSCPSPSQIPKVKIEKTESSDSEFESSLEFSTNLNLSNIKMEKPVILADETTESEDLDIIFAEVFLLRAQQRIEGDGRNPALYQTFIQTLNNEGESGGVDQKVLFKRIEELLKDYPDLVDEFAGMLRPEITMSTGRFIEHRRAQIQLKFLELVEDFTPQLKSKIIQKLKILRSEIPLTKERVLTVIQSLIPEIQNPVVIDALKALFMDLFCPQSTFSNTDFEKIEMDPDDTKHEPQTPNVPHAHHVLPEVQASSHEVVTLPPEKEITATNTCPCKCHDDPNNSSFHSRSRHCEDCSLKFQGGKLFLHSGRTLKAVNIEFSSPEIAKNVLASEGNIVKSKDKIRPSSSSPSSSTSTTTGSSFPSNSVKPGKIEDHLSDKEKDSKGPECKRKKVSTSPIAANSIITSPTSSPTDSEFHPTGTSPSSSGSLTVPWSMEDDKIILTVYNEEDDPDIAWTKIQDLLPTRALSDIKLRLAELVELLKAYKEESLQTESSTIDD